MIRVTLILVIGYLCCNVYGISSMREWCSSNSSFLEPSSSSCKGYWECDRGNVTYRTCPTLKSFDSVKSECVWAVWSNNHVTCGQQGRHVDESWCSLGSKYKSAVNGLCNSYYSCDNGQLSIEKCSWPFDFNPIDRVCHLNIWPVAFECYKFVPTQPPTTVKPRCPSGSMFNSPYPMDCTKYYRCDRGTETIEQCGTWQKFDSVALQCRYDYWGSDIQCATVQNHSTKQIPTIQPTTRTVPSSRPTTRVVPSSQSSTKPQSKFVCSQGDYFTKVNADDCQKYYLCSNGTITEETCYEFSRFDPLTHVCVFEFIFNRVDCSAVPDKPVCKLGYRFRTGYPGDCSKYYTCDKGKVTVESCGTLQKFDLDTNDCRYDTLWSNIKCEPSNPTAKPTTVQPTPTPTTRVVRTTQPTTPRPKLRVSCLRGNHFTSVDPDDCQKYYLCSNGTVTQEKCFLFNKFNPLTHDCQFHLLFFGNVNCTAKSAKPVCKVGDNYKTSYAGNSRMYWNCNNGQLNQQDCASLLSYDDSTQRCKFNVFGYNLQQKLPSSNGLKSAHLNKNGTSRTATK